MANPDIRNLTDLKYNSTNKAVTNAASTVMMCGLTNVEVIDKIVITNIDGTNDAAATLTHVGSDASVALLSTINVAADTAEVIDGPIVLTEGEYLTAVASANGDIVMSIHHRTMTDQ